MYQTSLPQFLEGFKISMDLADKAGIAGKRINNIIEYLTFYIYAYICRGLFESHKLLYAFLMLIKIRVREGTLKAEEFDCFLKGGAALDVNAIKKNPCPWINDIVWCNIIQASSLAGLEDFADSIYRNEQAW